MARDSDGLAVRKWAKSETALVSAPTDITPSDGLPASYGLDTFISLEVFNYLWRQVTGLGQDIAQHGVLEWDASQEYLHPSFVIGSDNTLYQSVVAPGGPNPSQDPVTDTGTYWMVASSLDIVTASESTPGIIRTATAAEVLAGTSVSTAVTPVNLKAVTNQLVSNAVDDVTSEPGEYVLTKDSGGKTWPWNTTKGRAILQYEPTKLGILQNNFLQNVPFLSPQHFRGIATDGETIWCSYGNRSGDNLSYHARVGGDYNIYAWTIDGVRDSDKDIYISDSIGLGQETGLVYRGNNLITTIGRRWTNDTKLIVQISVLPATYGTVGNPVGALPNVGDTTRGVITDGNTIWVNHIQSNFLLAYSIDGTRQNTMDIDLSSAGTRFYGVATDGTTIWVCELPDDTSDDDRHVRAFDIATKTYDSGKDISFVGSGVDFTLGTALGYYDKILYVSPSPNVLKYQLPQPRKLTVGSNIYETVGQNEVTGASIGDTIRADLLEDDDFAIVYPVY